MHQDQRVGNVMFRLYDDPSACLRGVIAILVGVLMAVGQTGLLPDDQSMLCFSAGAVALTCGLTIGRAEESRGQDCGHRFRADSARSILEEVERLHHDPRTLREFGRLLCETTGQSLRRRPYRTAISRKVDGISSERVRVL